MSTLEKSEPLTSAQRAAVLAVLQFNHDYYRRQGMHPAHMHPEEVANEIANALRTGIVPDRLDHATGRRV